MSTEERLTTLEQNVDRLISLNENVVALIVRLDARIEQNERHIQQTQRLWIAVAKHYGLLDDIDFDTNDLDLDTN